MIKKSYLGAHHHIMIKKMRKFDRNGLIHQLHCDELPRTEQQEWMFAVGLRLMHVNYGHKGARVVLLTDLRRQSDPHGLLRARLAAVRVLVRGVGKLGASCEPDEGGGG
jgi:hypothetical protein